MFTTSKLQGGTFVGNGKPNEPEKAAVETACLDWRALKLVG
ncbi:hypothetical protein ACAW74_16280 [Fibrella sp. WM1]